MPAPAHTPPGAPRWADLTTSDTARARAFYGDLLGWESQEPNEEFGGYVNFTRNGVRVAGLMAKQPGMADVPDLWSVYLDTEDATKAVETATARGAQALVPPMPVGELGTMAVVIDPTGAAVGIWQPGTHHGFGVVGEHGAPGWFELHTRDYAAAVDFYRDVFRWQTRTESDTEDLRYTTLVDDSGEQYAGVMDATRYLPEGAPAHWAVYFAVDDTDAAVTRLGELGGSVLIPAVDTPYGRIAAVADPTGAAFRLLGRNAATPAP